MKRTLPFLIPFLAVAVCSLLRFTNLDMKAVDLLNALNEKYALELPVEMADIERLRLYRYAKNGKKIGMLNTDAIRLA